jgi:hypothetical protein
MHYYKYRIIKTQGISSPALSKNSLFGQHSYQSTYDIAEMSQLAVFLQGEMEKFQSQDRSHQGGRQGF